MILGKKWKQRQIEIALLLNFFLDEIKNISVNYGGVAVPNLDRR